MIKLQIEDATLQTLDPALLPHVQWKSIKISDLEGVNSEVLNTYLLKMSKSVIKSLLKNKRATLNNLSTEQWLEILEQSYVYDGWDVLSIVQMPYEVIREILGHERNAGRYGRYIACSQDAIPVNEALKYLTVGDINQILITGKNPAICHYMFTDEGLQILFERHRRSNIIRNLRYLTTEEFSKLNRTFKNRKISIETLRRADACGDGQRYCRDVLRELNRSSITWDEAINVIRSNPSIRKRKNLLPYMDWIYERAERLDEVK